MYMAVALLVWVAWIINTPRPRKGDDNKIQKWVFAMSKAHFLFKQDPERSRRTL
jgi:hypothetical protein